MAGKKLRTLHGQLPSPEKEEIPASPQDAYLSALLEKTEKILPRPRHGGRIILDREALDMLSIYKESFPQKMSYSEVIRFLLKRTNRIPPVYLMLFRLLSRLASGLDAGAKEKDREEIRHLAVPVLEYLYDFLREEGHFPNMIARNEKERGKNKKEGV